MKDKLDRKELKAGNKYRLLLGGHGFPLGPEFYDLAVKYYETVLKVVKEAPDVKTAKEKMIAAYPKYQAVFLLDAMLPAFYKKGK